MNIASLLIVLKGAYCEGDAIGSNTGRYSESMSYDANGNVTSLTRYGQGALMDNLTIAYSGNQPSSVSESATDNNASGAVQQVTNYYPFGAPYADAAINSDFQPYKYNGKELDKMHGLNTYDYGARQHDPILARWDRIDPLCEKYYSLSPYAYCGNNPMNAIDPDGKKVYLFSTSLPGASWFPFATHTFIVVQDSKGNISGEWYFADCYEMCTFHKLTNWGRWLRMHEKTPTGNPCGEVEE